jgi:hypothetical protein
LSKVGVARLFVKARGPYAVIPSGGKKIMARIAKDFTVFINGVTEQWNTDHNTELSPEEGLIELLNSNVTPSSLFNENLAKAESARGVINSLWAREKGFEDGWKWMTSEFASYFVWYVLDKPYEFDEFHKFDGAPTLRKILIEHPKGEKWMVDFVNVFRGFLYPGH